MPSGGGFLVFVLLPGLLLLSLRSLLLPPLGSSMRSKRLRPGLTAVSNGLRVPDRVVGFAGAEGMRARRMGWPWALAPSNSRMAVRAEATER